MEAEIYNCGLCNKTFTRLENLRRHYKSVSHCAKENTQSINTNYVRELKELNDRVKELNDKITNDLVRNQEPKYSLDEIKEMLNKHYINMKNEDKTNRNIKEAFRKQTNKINSLKQHEKENGEIVKMSLKEFLS